MKTEELFVHFTWRDLILEAPDMVTEAQWIWGRGRRRWDQMWGKTGTDSVAALANIHPFM